MTLFIDDDPEKYARRRRCHCLREDGPVFGLAPAEEIELAALDAEFGPDLSVEAFTIAEVEDAHAHGFLSSEERDDHLGRAFDPAQELDYKSRHYRHVTVNLKTGEVRDVTEDDVGVEGR